MYPGNQLSPTKEFELVYVTGEDNESEFCFRGSLPRAKVGGKMVVCYRVNGVARQKIRAASTDDFFRCVVALTGSLESPPSNLLKATRKPDVLVLSEIRG